MKSGWCINTSIGIDFTLSNRPIEDLRSLHRQDYQRKGEMNQYEKAIFEAAGVLESYSLGRKFAMFGFGGIPQYLEVYKDQTEVIKCWNLMGEIERTEENEGEELKVQGVMGALGIYHKAVMRTQLAGPTYFAGLLRRFQRLMEYEISKYPKTFSVLILLTDGCIHDM